MKETLKSILTFGLIAIGGYALYSYYKSKASIPNTSPTTTPSTPSVGNPIKESRILFYNFSTIGLDNYGTIVNFKIQQNGVTILDTTSPIQDNVHYLSRIDDWDRLNVNVGDDITLFVYVLKSGSGGNTIGNVVVVSTTGTSGFVTLLNNAQEVPNEKLIAQQQVGDMDVSSNPITFKVESNLNYAIKCTYFQ